MNEQTNKPDKEEKKWNWLPWANSIAMILSGLALGWMVGMSTTPIIKDVIVSLLAVITTIMGLIAGYNISTSIKDGSFSQDTDNKKDTSSWLDYIKNVNLLPIGLFMICMAYGASRGLGMKNNYTYDTDYKQMAKGYGIADSTFDQKYKEMLFRRTLRIAEENSDTSKIDSPPKEPDDTTALASKFTIYDLKKNIRSEIGIGFAQINKRLNKIEFLSTEGVEGKGTGLHNGATSRRECDEANTYPADILKDWLLGKVSGKDSIRISLIPIENEIKLKEELKNICSLKK